MLKADDAVLAVIDIQGKLAEQMAEKEELFRNVRKLVRGARVLGIPVVPTEQYPEGLGPTRPQIAEAVGVEPIAKRAFSCCGEPAFVAALDALGRAQVLLCGIEAHVCVYQTARDLVASGREAHVVQDAVSSRTVANRCAGILKAKDAGAELTTVETALFEMLGTAEGEAFKQIIKIVK
jgi:nicotinamidase-related amidase